MWPTRRRSGQRVSSTDMTSAPAAGAARSRPSPPRADMQNVFGEHRQQRLRAAQQHREQIQRHRAQQGLAPPHIFGPGQQRTQSHRLAWWRYMVVAHSKNQHAANREKSRAGRIHRRGAGEKNQAAQRRPANHGGLHAGRRKSHGARQQAGRHQHRRQRLLRRHLERARNAEQHRQAQQQFARRPGNRTPCVAATRMSATVACATRQAAIIRPRCTRSTTCPASSVNNSEGTNWYSPTSPRSHALAVSSYICQPTATISIWLPVVLRSARTTGE